MFNRKRFSAHSYKNFSGSGLNTPELRAKDPSWKTSIDEFRMVNCHGPLSPLVAQKENYHQKNLVLRWVTLVQLGVVSQLKVVYQ